jgi:predicted nuclease of predicted toxin-antitoxin system
VKFLVDHQLPPALARFLQSAGHDGKHVRELGLKEADDKTIWNRAISNEQILVSKDEDFWYLAMAPKSTGRLVGCVLGIVANKHCSTFSKRNSP